jgi:hypothetical protein
MQWVVELPAGSSETFRVRISHPIDNPNCRDPGVGYSCTTYSATAVVTATAIPFGEILSETSVNLP